MKLVELMKGEAIAKLRRRPGASIDFFFTDPPYGHGNNNNNDLIARREVALGRNVGPCQNPSRPILNDGPEANELVRDFFREAARLLRCCCCCCCCCCGGGGPDPQFARWSLWLDEVMRFKQLVVWDKGRMGMGWHYRRSYETVLVGQKGAGKCAWFDETKRVENVIRPGDYGIRKIIPRAEQHPTEKPIELAMHFIGLHTQPGDLVCDPFMGSGSTGIAALRLGRRFLGIELDPHWYAVAKRRIAAEVKRLSPGAPNETPDRRRRRVPLHQSRVRVDPPREVHEPPRTRVRRRA